MNVKETIQLLKSDKAAALMAESAKKGQLQMRPVMKEC